jgi:hypothetical protein
VLPPEAQKACAEEVVEYGGLHLITAIPDDGLPLATAAAYCARYRF